MKKALEYLIPIIIGIIIIGFLAYIIIPVLSGMITVILIGVVIVALLMAVKKFLNR